MANLSENVAGLKAAGEETRLRILALLSVGELSVKDLTDILLQSQPRVSRHLRLLCESDLIDRFPEGSWVYYRLRAGHRRDEAGKNGWLSQMLAELDGDDPQLRQDRERMKALKSEQQVAALAYFSSVAQEWDEIRGVHASDAQVEAAILACVKGQKFSTLVDLGTGTGRMLELLNGQFETGIGLDSSRDMLSVARAKLDSSHIGHASVRFGDLIAPPLPRASADLVVMHQVLHYFDDPARAIAASAQLLTPNGQLLIVDFAAHELEFLRRDHAHRRLGFSHAQMLGWLRAQGMSADVPIEIAPEAGKDGVTVSIWLASKTGTDINQKQVGQ